ncbi:hypothetical protein M9H77_19292 [Catharanthus roseus]|uniref:Uncharacterized protein n=1 Tax=Catharanthus roseus TaxID=4058 RepID=A0ACC0B9U4_CATRO|nr:hypothetical protein M9H77_19292 [Catharanthus roseus]
MEVKRCDGMKKSCSFSKNFILSSSDWSVVLIGLNSSRRLSPLIKERLGLNLDGITFQEIEYILGISKKARRKKDHQARRPGENKLNHVNSAHDLFLYALVAAEMNSGHPSRTLVGSVPIWEKNKLLWNSMWQDTALLHICIYASGRKMEFFICSEILEAISSQLSVLSRCLFLYILHVYYCLTIVGIGLELACFLEEKKQDYDLNLLRIDQRGMVPWTLCSTWHAKGLSERS